MNLTHIALARHHAYTLLSRLFLDGLTEELWPYAQAVPELTAVLPSNPNFDETAVAHHTLFAFNLFPYESIYRDASGLLGGSVTDSILSSYQDAGFAIDDDATSSDHIGHELALLAFLCGAEADAREDNLPTVALQMQVRQRDFLQKHLLNWLFPFVLAVKQQGNAFFTAVATLTTDLITNHATELSSFVNLTIPNLPDPPDLLANEKTSLKDIAAYLTNPVYCGIFLSRDDVGRIARAHNLPRGFGKRDLMLHNLLKAAVQYDALPNLLETLHTITQDWVAAYQQFAEETPILTPFLQIWNGRVQTTQQLLTTIQEASGELASNE
ncbi:MAG: molecular chaperone TorD family protein [Ardenticatenaceae bacterium]|nr:molecular chaperone TorD family protein [Anaerolineales bacterium]MCB8920106.1 molecular chaperone TorD family protein [Ardenticatenaceae bacterium]MCB8991799.1 molecular chaperone TorD family protein [Ardenticatenaceae bacterium]